MTSLRARGLLPWLVAAAPLLAPGAAAANEIIVETEIFQFSGTGSGSVPLVRDLGNTLPGSVDGWGFAAATATISESTEHVSSVVASIVLDPLAVTMDITATWPFLRSNAGLLFSGPWPCSRGPCRW